MKRTAGEISPVVSACVWYLLFRRAEEVLKCSVVSELPWKADKWNFSSPELKTGLLWAYPVALAVFISCPCTAEGNDFQGEVGSAV